MKNHARFLLSLAMTFSLSLCVVSCSDDDNDSNEPTPDVPETPTHEAVDLGLPSGTLWATTNVGAETALEYGDYFAWGEVTPKDEYTWDTYKLSKTSGPSSFFEDGANWDVPANSYLIKYNSKRELGDIDNLTILEDEDDAATANWGSEWQMPTLEQWNELVDANNCTWEWRSEEMNDGTTVNYYKITSKVNGNSIALPANGRYQYDGKEVSDVGEYGHYWAKTSRQGILSLYAYEEYFFNGYNLPFSSLRMLGQGVRPVKKQ